MNKNDDPTCPACGQWMPPGHRCPRKRQCIDCGQPADMFVPDPDALALDEVEMMRQATADPDDDRPLCDSCFYRRARDQRPRRQA